MTSSPLPAPLARRLQGAAEQLATAGRLAYQRGWLPATSGNLSARLDHDHIAITVSGKNKGELSEADFMLVDREGTAFDPSLRPSAETALHLQIYQHFPWAGAVLHTHSLHATLISRNRAGGVLLQGYELLKAFRGVSTHESSLFVPIVENDQEIPRLAQRLEACLKEKVPGYLIAGHGLYTWGSNVDEALRHLEAFEFLFQCEYMQERVSS